MIEAMAARSGRFYASLLFALCVDSVAGQNNGSSIVLSSPNASLAINTSTANATIPAFTSVASVFSSMSQQASALASIPAIPIPADHNKSESFVSMVAAMPPVPVPSGGPTFEQLNEMFGSYLLPLNGSNLTESSTIAGRQSRQKVMICGDSMTQGAEGDWTWRYRIWEWAQDNNLNWQFVGPYTGTQDSAKPGPPQPPPLYGSPSSTNPPLTVRNSGGYALDVKKAFLQDGGYNHFSVWGRAVAFDISTPPGQSVSWIQGMVQQYQPDILLVMLGFNDVGWFYSDGAGLLVNMGTFIKQARAANPNIAIALANVPQRSWLGRQDLVDKTTYYDNRIGSYVDQWTTAQSPIRLVPLRETYSCDVSSCPAGYDGLHPDSLGDYEIARAFSLTLSQFASVFKLAGTPQALDVPNPVPLRPLTIPGSLQVVSSAQGVTATWEAVYGSYGYRIQTKDGDGPWVNGTTQANRWDTTWAFANHTYSIRVAATAGGYDYLNTDFSPPQSAVAQPSVPSVPQNVLTAPYGSDGMFVQWNAPSDQGGSAIIEYNVIIWDLDTDCAFLGGAAFQHSPAIITGLNPGHRYFIAPTAWNDGGPSFPNIGRTVRIGGNTPAAPSTPVLQPISDGQLHITFTGDSIAAGYTMFGRNKNENDGSDPFGAFPVQEGTTCFDSGLLFPGYWNYEWCVGAYNGDFYSQNSTCTSLPQMSSYTPASKCPVLPGWCPGYGKGSAPTGEDGQGENGGSVGDGGGEGGPGPSSGGGGGGSGSGSGSGSGGSGSGSGSGGSGGSGSGSGPSSNTTTGPPGHFGSGTGTGGYPTSNNGNCAGPDCQNGICVGTLCIALGCTGSDCNQYSGQCSGPLCTVFGCLGQDCDNGQCSGSANDCITAGCTGGDCGSDGQCHGSNCVSIGCSGDNCGSNGQCTGQSCNEQICFGTGCSNNGMCTGDGCTGSIIVGGKRGYPVITNGNCRGSDCQNGQCFGIFCYSFGCSGSNCDGGTGLCKGSDCTVHGCTGPDCRDGLCVGPDCSSHGCRGSDCHNGLCSGIHCISIGCHGSDCSTSSGLCSGPRCSVDYCSGTDCDSGSCTGQCSDSGEEEGGENEPCETTTVTDCSVFCYATTPPAATPTTSCFRTTCGSPKTGCNITPATISTTNYFPECTPPPAYVSADGSMTVGRLGDGGPNQGYIDPTDYGTYTTYTYTPPSTSSTSQPAAAQPTSTPPTIGAADCVGNPVSAEGYGKAVDYLDTPSDQDHDCSYIPSQQGQLADDCREGAYVHVYNIADGVTPLCQDVVAAARALLQSCTSETDQGGELVNGNVGVNNQYHVGVGSC